MVEIRSKELRQVLEHLQRYDIQLRDISMVFYSCLDLNFPPSYGTLYSEGSFEGLAEVALQSPQIIFDSLNLRLSLDWVGATCSYRGETFDIGLSFTCQYYTLYGERVSEATKDALDRAFKDIGWHEESH